MDIGFSNAGFDVKLCVEIDPSCCDTLRKNLNKSTKVLNEDVSRVSGKQLLDAANINFGELDLLFGGPPCQSFSLAGNRKGLEDDRGRLVFDFIRLVKQTAPKVFVMENVAAMASWQSGEVLSEIENALTTEFTFGALQMKYRVEHSILDAANFGVPQHRKRIFIVGNRENSEFKFPTPTHGKSAPFATVGETLSSLPAAHPPSKVAQRVSQSIPGRRAAHGY